MESEAEREKVVIDVWCEEEVRLPLRELRKGMAWTTEKQGCNSW